MDPIASQWQRLASMKRQSLDFLPLLLSLTIGINRTSTTKLQGNDAKVALDVLDEVGFRFALARRSGSNLRYTIYQVFRGGRIPNKYERDILGAMRTLAHDSCQVPSRYQVKPHPLIMEKNNPIGTRGSSEIQVGKLGEKVVAVKTLRGSSKLGVRIASSYFFGVY
jgi:hypothetical protein